MALDIESGERIWKTENNVISNVAATDSKVFILTYDDELQILDIETGALIETIQVEPPINFFDRDINPQAEGYQVAVDETNQILYLLLGDSNQLFAFRIKSSW
jgi:outer membrane protein assembly factor BamB